MKNLILILMLCLSFNMIAQNKLTINGYIETGWIKNTWAIQQNDFIQYHLINNPIAGYGEIMIRFSYKRFHYKNIVTNIFQYSEGKTLSVIDINFVSQLYWENNILRVGYEHYCLHPVINQLNQEVTSYRRASGDKLFVRFNF